MQDIEIFFAMGGYAGYVWPSFAFAAVIIVFMSFSALNGLQKAKKRLRALQETHET